MKDRHIFFSETNSKEEYTSEYLLIKTNSIINKKKTININELYDAVQSEYNDVKINKYAFKELIFCEFYSIDNDFESIDAILSYELNLFFNKNSTESSFNYNDLVYECISIINNRFPISIQDLSNSVKENHNNILNFSAFKKFVNRHFIVNKKHIEGIKKQTLFYYCLSESNQNINDSFKNKISDIIESIHVSNDDYLITDYHFYSFDILSQNGITKTKDLKDFDTNKIYQIVKNNYSNFEKDILKLSVPYLETTVLNIRNRIEELIDERTLLIILKRNGYFKKHGTSLEEIGNEFGVTRERVRQLETKGKKKLSDLAKNYLYDLDFISKRLFKNRLYLSIDEVFKTINNEEGTYCYLLLVSNANNNLIINNEYGIILNSCEISINDIENKVVDKFGNFIPIALFEKAEQFEKSIINNLYKYNEKKKLFKIKSILLSDLIEEIIYESFPNGYRVYDENDYKELSKNYTKLYGEDSSVPTNISVRGLVNRKAFCQYDRGKVISRRRAIKLDDSLIKRIINYISDYDDVVYYASIFEVFKKELYDKGIKNKYYLKGVIDPCLPTEYITKRDYICISKDFISSSESIKREIECFKGEFSISDLQEKYPGVKEYVFQTIMYDRDDVIWLSGKNFILLKNLVISKELKDTLIYEIEYLFAYLSSDFVSSGKIFSRMMIMHEDLMSTIPIINSKNKLLSLIDVIIPDKYTVIRQFIIKRDRDVDITAYSLIEDFIKDKDSFSSSDIREYCEKINIRGLYSFQEFIIDNSDEFVQINVDTCVRKNLFALSEANLFLIKKEIDFYINSFGPIYTENYNNYLKFPSLKYKWNKYLLVGIIRCYLDSYYEIEYTNNISTKTEYVIRGVKV